MNPPVLASQSDERLTELSRAGSETAFEALVVRHRPDLVRVCARIVGDGDAEEAVQEALMRAHGALLRGHEVRSAPAWLRRIARNSALNLLRTRSARMESARECAGVEQGVAEERLSVDELTAALRALAPRQREAIVMRELEGRSYAEIADRLGTSPGAVRQLLNRARTAVRARLAALLPWDGLLRWAVTNPGGIGARVGAVADTCAAGAKLCVALIPTAAIGVSAVPVARAVHHADPRVAVVKSAPRPVTHVTTVRVGPTVAARPCETHTRFVTRAALARRTPARTLTRSQPTTEQSIRAPQQFQPTPQQSQPIPKQFQRTPQQSQPTPQQTQPSAPLQTERAATSPPAGAQYGSPPS
jgi:RNA polymerase sigma factor (sigma-70 family)